MKTLNTIFIIFILGITTCSIMIMGNNQEVNLEIIDEIPEPEFIINFDELFQIEENRNLSLDEIEYIELEGEILF
ncbi:hypothetical protein L0P88_19950 [Muricauda sp. SCSIO 64092]|uniref:hypothetical protein n=1 Tax=Allomuricauda sp. SCSIO 64092 TaxID=2908842 RepID=UPI001FF2939B|nr:hypothetical protein [Muricauda sp. SCSIO 64092]UOY06185.1 hypothetical protein L0P88_19950 [Muricauda sp. SCSIO 64092]